MGADLSRIDAVIARHGRDRSELTALLLALEHEFSYLPPESLDRVAAYLDVPAIQVYQVARFYTAFHLSPRGRHVISVCAGTACFVLGNRPLLDRLRELLNIGPGETTPDGEFTLEMVNCPGNCPAGPVMTVDGHCHGRVTVEQIAGLIGAREAAHA